VRHIAPWACLAGAAEVPNIRHLPEGARARAVSRKGNPLSLIQRLFGDKRTRAEYRPLYDAIVATGRDARWYREGQVPDTLDGRFDMVAALLALVLLRLEADGAAPREASALVTEIFIDDMDGSLRQIGIGDFVVGKHVGRMVSALGGRLTAFRSALASGGELTAPVTRNIFHDAPPSPEAVAFVAKGLQRFRDGLAALPLDRLLAGALPS
jgi:cytochrome b pre-mRNA-processing protein 3